jgi:hypothetical protein
MKPYGNKIGEKEKEFNVNMCRLMDGEISVDKKKKKQNK